MAELENLLLEAAGRTSSSGKNQRSHSSSRRRRRGSYSDGGSDSRGDDSDDGRGYASRNPSGPRVPLKKRLDPTEIDDEQGSQEEGGYNDSDVGSDLYKDEDDRRKLAEMSELQRELILSERAQKKDDESLKEKFRPTSRTEGRLHSPGKTLHLFHPVGCVHQPDLLTGQLSRMMHSISYEQNV